MSNRTGKKNMHITIRLSALTVALMAAPGVMAQTQPDAGRVLQQLVIPPEPIAPSVNIQIDTNTPLDEVAPGGSRIELKEIRFHGMTQLDNAQLQAAVAEAVGHSYDMAGLRHLANRVTLYYREQGYPFARAYLPPQHMQDGVLLIEIIEGRYGKVTATGEEKLAAQAQPFLSTLAPGDVIETDALERATLILGDQPGVVLTPIMKPGEEVGTGDLEGQVAYGPRVEGKVGLDNAGNRYSGRGRALAAVNLNSPFMLGDQIKASGMLTEENLWFGQLAYAMPLGTSGLRGEISYAHTYYELGKEFSDIDATGTANITSVGLSYPLLRSRSRNLILSAQYQHKNLEDEYGSVDLTNNKSSDSLPLTLQFDMRDQLAGGGITYGAVTWTAGRLSLDSDNLRLQDRFTAKSNGSFQKLNIDIARLQRLTQSLMLFGRVSGQLADENLDSSETISLGGVNGVRAYPQGEGNGDRGVLGQFEVRYNLREFTPYAFYDAGTVRINADPWTAGENHRNIAGGGVGLRITHRKLSFDASLAWATHGGDPESDSKREVPRLWLKAEYSL